MNWELAKELKEAGWPQRGKASKLAKPTLSELIEACGERFVRLERDIIDPLDGVSWIAIGKFGNLIEHHGYTSNPEEAVAMLWLALNK